MTQESFIIYVGFAKNVEKRGKDRYLHLITIKLDLLLPLDVISKSKSKLHQLRLILLQKM